jgi:penicillin amidase
LGHNREYAYFTLENDDIDLYQEQNNPANANEYKRQMVSVYEIQEKTIKVKDSSNVVLKVNYSTWTYNERFDRWFYSKPVSVFGFIHNNPSKF